jgi:hypothetical protein
MKRKFFLPDATIAAAEHGEKVETMTAMFSYELIDKDKLLLIVGLEPRMWITLLTILRAYNKSSHGRAMAEAILNGFNWMVEEAEDDDTPTA